MLSSNDGNNMDGKGVTFTTPLAVTSQFPFCSLPLRLDSYRGCAFDCAYCFARSRGGNVPDSKIVPGDPRALRRAFRAAQGNSTSLVAEMLRRRVPIHFGGMSDPFQPAEKRHRVTAHFLETVVEYNHPVVISTKSHLLCDEPYLTLIQECKSILCQFSFCSLLDRRVAQVEPHSSSPTRLLEAVRQLSSMGVPVTARWQPYIAEFSEDPEDFVPAVAAAGVRHVSLEHLKIPLRAE